MDVSYMFSLHFMGVSKVFHEYIMGVSRVATMTVVNKTKLFFDRIIPITPMKTQNCI